MCSCPTCDRSFETQRGLRVHHTTVHDVHLPNRKCEQCGTEFYNVNERKYCSDHCLQEAAPYAGESNPNFRDAKAETECEQCGTTFEYYPSEKQGVYCRSCTEEGAWRSPPELSGSEHPSWNGGKLTLSCDVCDAEVERWPSMVAEEAVLCGQACREAWLSETFTGAGHPNWEGGDPGPYGKGWAAVRSAARDRDGYACQLCGTAKAELGRNPDVHHIIPVRAFEEAADRDRSDAHQLGNVITLCVDCHRKADFGRISVDTLRSHLPE